MRIAARDAPPVRLYGSAPGPMGWCIPPSRDTIGPVDLTVYQIIAPLVSFVAIVYAWNLVFRQKKTVWEALLWTVFWSAIAYIAIEPDSITYLTK
ncbi:hypothetical protein COU79_03945, partial [Candidatus Peregrinibacteria bacterium CG10_big_fil_rev_8_21_14_0_10_54_7]